MSSSSNGAEAKVRAAPRDAAGGRRAAGAARARGGARAGGDDAGAAASDGGRARSQETDEGEERSILKLPSESRIRAPSTGGKSLSWNDEVGGGLIEVHYRAAKESEIPNFKGSDLGHFPLVSADSWTSDRLSERSRSVDAFSGTRARGTLTLKRR